MHDRRPSPGAGPAVRVPMLEFACKIKPGSASCLSMDRSDQWAELERQEAREAAIRRLQAEALNANLPPSERLPVGVLAMLLDVWSVPPGPGDHDDDVW